MTTVNVQEAKTHLSALLARVEKGEVVTIARAGLPVATLTPFLPPAPRQFGTMNFRVPDSFFDPLQEEELALWE
ncbi:MAG: type II toxin-antitoxin system prevent-host-death family antitoxin [Ornithinimicrobium sp.]